MQRLMDIRRTLLLGVTAILIAWGQTSEGSLIISSSTTIAAGNSTFDGSDLIVSNCTVTINGAHHFNSLLLTNGAVLTDSTGVSNTVLVINNDMAIDPASRVDVSGLGYAAGTGPGAGGDTGYAGGYYGGGAGYGGQGGNSAATGAPGGSAYGLLFAPTNLGSGGGHLGGAGGGAIQLMIGGSLTVNGAINAAGMPGNSGFQFAHYCSGGGSGGSIYLTAGALAGTGAISANGGASICGSGGGGGGGRIAVFYATSSYTGTFSVAGGSGAALGGAGTILVSSNSIVQLIVDGGGNPTTTPTPINTSNLPANVLVQGGGEMLMSGNVMINGNLTVTGTNSTTELFGTNGVAQNVNLINGGILSHVAGASNTVFVVSNNMTIDAASRIDVTGEGYSAGSGPGAGIEVYGGFSYYGSGGGYGGLGGNTASSDGNGPGGGTYGLLTSPTVLGSGGGNGLIDAGGSLGEIGGAGGGAIQLAVIGTLTVNGVITAAGADGGAGCYGAAGGGSGGSLFLTLGTLAGSGSISASGGDAGCVGAGGGGGGRISISYSSSTYNGSFTDTGGVGANNGGPGTILLNSNLFGQLIIDGGGVSNSTPTTFVTAMQVPNVQVQGGAQVLFGGGVTVNGNLVIQGTNTVLTLIGTNYVTSDASILNGGILTQPAGQSNTVLMVSDDMTVDGASRLDISGKGFPPGTGPGAGVEQGSAGAYYGSGAGYGGAGGNSVAAGGSTYGSLTAPTGLGSGGGSGGNTFGTSELGGSGGGAIQLVVSNVFTVNGVVTAAGASGIAGCAGGAGGGSGGSLDLTMGTLAGNGSISANGGNSGCTGAGGGGGGGRIACYFSNNSFSGTFSVAGGTGNQNGQPGTFYPTPIDNQLTLSQPVYGNIVSPYLVDRWNFSAVAGQQIRLQQINFSYPGIVFDLNGPDGWSGFFGITNESALINLTNSGDYNLTVRAQNIGYDGAYTFVLQETSETNLTLNTAFTGNFVGNGQAQLIAINVTNNGPILITLNNPGTKNSTELYAQFGAPPTRGTFGYESINPNSPSQSILIPNAYVGTYYVLVYGNQIVTPSNYAVEVQTGSVFLTSVIPNDDAVNYPITLNLNGSGFLPGTAVQMIDPNGLSHSAVSTMVDSFTQITATFPSNSLPMGLYSIQVSLPNGASTILDNSFQLSSSGTPNITSGLTVPSVSWEFSPSTVYAQYGNTGTGPTPAPLMILTAEQNENQDALLGMDSSLLVQGNWTSAQQPLGFDSSAQFLASGHIPGTLQPGENLTVPIYWAGWRGPFIAHGRLNWNLGYVTADDPTPIDWPSIEATIEPSFISTDAWQAVSSVLTNQIGATWGNYVNTLDNSAFYFGQLGLNVQNVNKLLAFHMMQADGIFPAKVLSSAIDASVSCPGLPLSFSRSYGERISQRYALGPLGRGWTHNWQYLLQLTADGTVTISSPDGSRRIFQTDRRGGYFDEAGDYGRLTATNNGDYALVEKSGLLYYFSGNGLLSYVRDPNGNRISLGYSGGLLTSLLHSSGQSIFIAYNNGLIQTATDSEGRVTTFSYDGAQHLQTVGYFDGTQINYSYSSAQAGDPRAHSLMEVAYTDGSHSFISYDANGRPTSISRDGGVESLNFAYQGPGLVLVTDAVGNVSSYYFDDQGMVAKTQNPGTNSQYFSFDESLHLTQFVDPIAGSYACAYDTNGNLTGYLDASGGNTSFTYRPLFNLLSSLKDPNGHATLYTNDSNGNLNTITYADNTAEHWGYDGTGNIVNWTNRRGQVVSYSYNLNGQMVSKSYPDGHTIQYYYNAHSLLTNITDSIQGVIALDYDARDYLTNILYPSGNGFSFLYDNAGRRINRVGTDGYILDYYYDSVGRLASLSNNVNGLLIQYVYDAAGRLSMEFRGNKTVTTYNYDNAARVQSITNFGPNAIVLSFYNYTYDSRGNVMSMTSLAGKVTYGYDALNQLTTVAYPSGRQVAYNYDLVGNRLSINDTGTNVVYTSNSVNEYLAAGDTAYTYDADGNLQSLSNSIGAFTFTYDFENRLTRVSGPDNFNWQCIYDALGHRSATVFNSATNQFLIDPTGDGDEAVEYNATGTLVTRYDYGLGLVSRIDAGAYPSYYEFDALGNTRQITDLGGSILNTYDYDAFGGVTSANETVSNVFQFNGRDGVAFESTGLYFMRSREFDPLQGRFLSADPMRTVGGDYNLYRFAFNNPIRFVDSNGQKFKSPAWFASFRGAVKKYLAADNKIFNGIFNANQHQASGDDDDVYSAVGGQIRDLGIEAGAEAGAGGTMGVALTAIGLVSTAVEVNDVLNNVNTISQELANQNAMGRQAGLDFDVFPNAGHPWWWWFLPGGLKPSDQQLNPNQKSAVNESAVPGDPNELVGPAGFSQQNFLTESNLFNYGIYFENTNATASAQIVQITDPLTPDLNWQTFQLSEIGFGDVFIAIPPNVQYFETNLPVSYSNINFEVEIEAGINLANGTVFANFFSIDPATSLPPQNGTGFLPLEDGTGRGSGHVSYTIQPQPNLATGTVIPNIAYIQFDENAAIPTDLVNDEDPTQGVDTNKQAIVTIDNSVPWSSVTALPPITTLTNFTVCWSGTNAGAAIVAYDIYVSTNSGPWNLWLAETTNNCDNFSGVVGNSYGFYSIAHDGAGLIQPTPAGANTTTFITVAPPVATPMTVARPAGLSVMIALPDISTNWIDVAGYPVSLIGIALTSTNGQRVYAVNLQTNLDGSYVITNTAFLGYMNPSNVNDQISYTISDSLGNTAPGLINILVSSSPLFGQITGVTPNGQAVTLNFAGQPGFNYNVERSTNLTTWVTILTTNAPPAGPFGFTDTFSDLGGVAPNSVYYRLSWTP